MKLTIARDDLVDVVGWAAHALTPRPGYPALAGLLLDATDDELTISAFDYDTSRRVSISADVAEPGRVLLPGRVLAEVVKALPNKPVDLVLSDSEVVLTCGASEFGLRTMPVDDYPTMPTAPDPIGKVDVRTLAAAIAVVVPATSNDTSLPMLTGIRVDIDGDTLTLAATDRYQMVSRTIGWEPASPDTAAGVMVPGRVLHDLVKSLPTGSATIGLSEQLAAISGEDRTTTVRLLDPQFIDYRSRLDLADYTIWASVEIAPFAAAVKRIALVAERHSPVRLNFSDGQMLVEAGGPDIGRGAEVVDAELSGDPIQIAFQPQYLLNALSGVDGDRVRIGMSSPIKPAVCVGVDADPTYRFLVMPIRLS